MSRSHFRKLAARAVGILVSFLLAEGLGWVALSFEGPRWEGWDRAARLRREVTDSAGALGVEDGTKILDRSLRRATGAYSKNVLHPFLGFVAEPTSRPGWAKRMNSQAASLGFPANGRALLQAPGPDKLVVGVFGGSVAQVLASGGEAELVEALAKLPRFTGREIVVLNLALGGMKQPQQLMALNYLRVLGLSLGPVFDPKARNGGVMKGAIIGYESGIDFQGDGGDGEVEVRFCDPLSP